MGKCGTREIYRAVGALVDKELMSSALGEQPYNVPLDIDAVRSREARARYVRGVELVRNLGGYCQDAGDHP